MTDLLDDLVRRLSGMSERHIIPGRIYSSFGGDGFYILRPQLLAMLGTFLPTDNDDTVISWFREPRIA
jgi:hypothetical protein